MRKIIRYWNQNRKQIIIIIAIIAFIIIMLQVVNELLKPTKESNQNNNKSNVSDLQKPTQSAITGQNVTEETSEENTEIIKSFIDYCNSSEIEKAYDLLSNDCKEEFGNLDTFMSDYYKRNFKTKKTYNLDFMFSEQGSYTYKVTYYEDDLLATGGTTTNKNFEDYITIINQNGERKLNINNFIKKQEINKTQATEAIQITIKNKRVYRSYEQYRILIKNNTKNTISISDGENSEDIYLLDKNEAKYEAFIHEIPLENLSIKPMRTIELDITFNKIYYTYRNIEKIQFNNICLDQENNIRTIMMIKIQ